MSSRPVERIVANLDDAVIAVARGQRSGAQAANHLIRWVARRLSRAVD
jgi:hypothetical protein